MKFLILIFCVVVFNIFTADLIIFSYNRPLQLYSYLESIENNVTGLEKIIVIFRTDQEYEAAYKQVKLKFTNIIYQKQVYSQDFKPLLNQAINNAGKYIIFGVDDIIVRDKINLESCQKMLESTKAYGFYFRLGKNINYCYNLNCPAIQPKLNLINENTYLFSFSEGSGDWAYPNSLDMVLLRTSSVKGIFLNLNYSSPNQLESAWSSMSNKKQNGLCPKISAIVNLPLNIVSDFKNKHLNSYRSKDFLKKFNEGYKLDIADISNQIPNSPHMNYIPKFIRKE